MWSYSGSFKVNLWGDFVLGAKFAMHSLPKFLLMSANPELLDHICDYCDINHNILGPFRSSGYMINFFFDGIQDI